MLTVGWSGFNTFRDEGGSKHQKRGIVTKIEPHRSIACIVCWENGETLAHDPQDLELLK